MARRSVDQTVSLLVARAQRGDRDAFGELFKQNHGAVYRLARFSLSEAQARDAVSETFLRAWVALPKYRERHGVAFRSWLYGIARHVVVDTIRAAARTRPEAHLPEAGIVFEQRVVDRVALAEAVSGLPEMQRRVIELKFLLGWSNPEIARELTKTTGAVNTLQWRALESLRKMMGSADGLL